MQEVLSGTTIASEPAMLRQWHQRHGFSPLNELGAQCPWGSGIAFVQASREIRYVDGNGRRVLQAWQAGSDSTVMLVANQGVLWAIRESHGRNGTLEIVRWNDPAHLPESYHLDCVQRVGHQCRVEFVEAGAELDLWLHDERVEDDRTVTLRRVILRRSPQGWQVDASAPGRRMPDRAPENAGPFSRATTDAYVVPEATRLWLKTPTTEFGRMRPQESVLLSDRPTSNVWELGAVTLTEPSGSRCSTEG